MIKTVSTARVPGTERFAFWRDIVWDAFVPVSLSHDDEGVFHGEVSTREIGPLTVARIRSSAQTVLRTPEQVARDAGGVSFLNMPLTGINHSTQDGRTARLSGGDFAVVDANRPFEQRFEGRCDQLSLVVPNELLAGRIARPEARTATRVSGGEGLGAVVGGMIRSLASMPPPASSSTATALADHVCGLIGLCLGEPTDSKGASPDHLTQAILDEINRSLGDPALAPADVAARVGISTRYLHRLLAQRGGPSFGALVQRRRLERSRAQLLDPTQLRSSVLEIALDNGFTDPSYFTRVFKRHFGDAPSELRAAVDRRRRTLTEER